MAKVCCSIEMEPKTLSERQLNQAREVAADAVQKMEPREDATRLLKGLRPVVSIKEMDRIVEIGEQRDGYHELDDDEEGKEKIEVIERPCQCSCVVAESPDQMNIKEPLSAPF